MIDGPHRRPAPIEGAGETGHLAGTENPTCAFVDGCGLRPLLGDLDHDAVDPHAAVRLSACARALASRPTIIFADEPTGNLDSRASAEVLGLLQQSVREMGQTIVMVTHDPWAASYADRVVFLADGRVIDEMRDPTQSAVLDRMSRLEARSQEARSPEARSPEARSQDA